MKKLNAIALILPILLFSSIGFSAWGYGPNLIQNGNFENYIEIQTPTYWSIMDDIPWLPTDLVGGMLNASVQGTYFQSSPSVLLNDTIYEIQLDFKIVAGNEGLFYGRGVDILTNRSWYSQTCYAQISFNSTEWVETSDLPECSLFDNATYLEDLGNGWTRIHAYMDMARSGLPETSTETIVIGYYPSEFDSVLLDNLVMQENGTTDNQILNGNFSDYTAQPPFPTSWFPTDYSDADCRGTTNNVQWNPSVFQYDPTTHYMNITYLFDTWTEDVLTSPFYLDPAKQYLISFDFKPLSEGYGINDENFSWLGTYSVEHESCYSEGWGIYRSWNTTHAFYETEIINFVDASIYPLGDGWYRYQEAFNPTLPEGENMAMSINGDGTLVKYSIANVKLMEIQYQCEGWECNTMGKMMIQTILAMIPLFVVVGIILITRPESILVLAMELMVAGVMTIVMITLI